ncbi:MAG: macro domain-containing protein [Thermoanaerobaculia bacterium]
MNASIFVGDIADADADALCTSTNPRLSLRMGTGASVLERGGSAVARACEAIVAAEGRLPAGSAHATTAGRLPHKLVIHCVASDAAHRSSTEIVRLCVRNAVRIATGAGCASLALPILASGHAHLRFDDSVQTVAEELRSAPLERVVFVVNDPEQAEPARAIVRRVLGGDVEISRSTRVEPESASPWD